MRKNFPHAMSKVILERSSRSLFLRLLYCGRKTKKLSCFSTFSRSPIHYNSDPMLILSVLFSEVVPNDVIGHKN